MPRQRPVNQKEFCPTCGKEFSSLHMHYNRNPTCVPATNDMDPSLISTMKSIRTDKDFFSDQEFTGSKRSTKDSESLRTLSMEHNVPPELSALQNNDLDDDLIYYPPPNDPLESWSANSKTHPVFSETIN